MEDNRWLRLIIVGLVLAALAVGYFLLSGRLAPKSITKTQSQVDKVVATANPNIQASPSATPASAYNMIVDRAQQSQELPRTGYPVGILAIFAVSAIISGWGLRKYPY